MPLSGALIWRRLDVSDESDKVKHVPIHEREDWPIGMLPNGKINVVKEDDPPASLIEEGEEEDYQRKAE